MLRNGPSGVSPGFSEGFALAGGVGPCVPMRAWPRRVPSACARVRVSWVYPPGFVELLLGTVSPPPQTWPRRLVNAPSSPRCGHSVRGLSCTAVWKPVLGWPWARCLSGLCAAWHGTLRWWQYSLAGLRSEIVQGQWVSTASARSRGLGCGSPPAERLRSRRTQPGCLGDAPARLWDREVGLVLATQGHMWLGVPTDCGPMVVAPGDVASCSGCGHAVGFQRQVSGVAHLRRRVSGPVARPPEVVLLRLPGLPCLPCCPRDTGYGAGSCPAPQEQAGCALPCSPSVWGRPGPSAQRGSQRGPCASAPHGTHWLPRSVSAPRTRAPPSSGSRHGGSITGTSPAAANELFVAHLCVRGRNCSL